MAKQNSLTGTLVAMTVMVAVGVLGGYSLPRQTRGQVVTIVNEGVAELPPDIEPIPPALVQEMADLAKQKAKECLWYLDSQQYRRYRLLTLPTHQVRDSWVIMSPPQVRWLDDLDVDQSQAHRFLKKAELSKVDVRIDETEPSRLVVCWELPVFTNPQAAPDALALPRRNFEQPARNVSDVLVHVRKEHVAYFAHSIFCALEESYGEEVAPYDLVLELQLVQSWSEPGFVDEQGKPRPTPGSEPIAGGLWSARLPAAEAIRLDWPRVGRSVITKLLEYDV